MAAIWTVGHSSRTLEDFLALLGEAGIGLIADVRRYPGSRRFPHFSKDTLQPVLEGRSIGYRHLSELGGRRGKPVQDSPNLGWRVAQFAAYADYMQSDAFLRGLDTLMQAATDTRTAVMCAEALPWQCHRRLIADALLVRGWQVFDIVGNNKIEPRALTPFARVAGTHLTYPDLL